jgi:hypothetical protein
MIDRAQLQKRARRKLVGIQRRRSDERYQRVMGRFIADGLLHTNQDIVAHHDPICVEDVLWAGEVEPRLLELLPALIVKRPSMFVDVVALPEDLAQPVRRLRRGLEPEPFRSIPGNRLLQWLPRVGRVGTVPARLKSFRFKPEDLRLLSALVQQLGVSETEVVRRGLRALA